MKEGAELLQVIKDIIFAYERRTPSCTPCEVTSITGEKTVNVKPIISPLNYEGAQRVNYEPLEYRDVVYGGIGFGDVHIYMPPRVGMRGIMLVTDYDVAYREQGVVGPNDVVRQQSSGYFLSIFEQGHRQEIDIKIQDGSININEDGTITIVNSAGKIKIDSGGDISVETMGKMNISAVGLDIKSITSLVEGCKEMNNILLNTLGQESPAIAAFLKG